jgi:hypothetical protein
MTLLVRSFWLYVSACVHVCVRERERERESVCVCVCECVRERERGRHMLQKSICRIEGKNKKLHLDGENTYPLKINSNATGFSGSRLVT